MMLTSTSDAEQELTFSSFISTVDRRIVVANPWTYPALIHRVLRWEQTCTPNLRLSVWKNSVVLNAGDAPAYLLDESQWLQSVRRRSFDVDALASELWNSTELSRAETYSDEEDCDADPTIRFHLELCYSVVDLRSAEPSRWNTNSVAYGLCILLAVMFGYLVGRWPL